MTLAKYRAPFVVIAAILIAAAVALSAGLMSRGDSHANIVPGEYSIEVNIASTQANVAVPFTVLASLVHAQPPYQSAQWFIEYDETLIDIDIAGTAKLGAAPSQCFSKNDNGTRVLLGCLDLGGPNITYSGNVWNIPATCIANGTAAFQIFGINVNSFVKIGAVVQPAHGHDDSIFCGPPPPTDTPTATDTPAPATNTPTPTPSNTATPTRTPTPSPTVDIPPDQNQFRQIAFDPASYGTGAQMLNAIDTAMEAQIGEGWNIVDAEDTTLVGNNRVLYSLQRGDILRRYDLDGNNEIDLVDAQIVLTNFGQPGISSFKHIVIDPASQPNGAALLAAIDAQMEAEIVAGWNVTDSTMVTLDGQPRLLFSLQRRTTPPNSDVNGSGEIDIFDAVLVLEEFGEVLPPLTPLALPPGPNRFRQATTNPALYSGSALLTLLDDAAESEIAPGYDPIDYTIVPLDGTDYVVASSQRSNRKHRADVNGDNMIDLVDAILVLQVFGQPGFSSWQFTTVDPTTGGTLQGKLDAIDLQMEGFIVQGFNITDSNRLTLDGNDRIVYGLQRRVLPQPIYDQNGITDIDIFDAVLVVALFGQDP